MMARQYRSMCAAADFLLGRTPPKYQPNFARRFSTNIVTPKFEPGDRLAFKLRELFAELFLLTSSILNHDDLALQSSAHFICRLI
jgi:hypothetical protein